MALNIFLILCSVLNGRLVRTNGMKSVNTPLLFFPHSQLPKIYQAFLMSATLNNDVQALKELVLHNPVSIGGIVLPGSKTFAT